MKLRKTCLRSFDAERVILALVSTYPASTKTDVMNAAMIALLRHCEHGEPPYLRAALIAASIQLVPVWRRLEAAGRITKVDRFAWVITPATISARI